MVSDIEKIVAVEKRKLRIQNWIEIQTLFRSGTLSVEAIAAKYGVSKVAIYKRAKKEGWQRDLSIAAIAAAKEKVALDFVAQKRLAAEQKRLAAEPVQPYVVPELSETEIIDSASDQIVDFIRQHRKSLGKTLELENRLVAQFEREIDLREKAYSDNPEDRLYVARLVEDGAKLLSLPQCSTVYRELTMAQSKRIEMERKILNMDDDQGSKGDPIQQLLDEIDGMTRVPPSIRDAG